MFYELWPCLKGTFLSSQSCQGKGVTFWHFLCRTCYWRLTLQDWFDIYLKQNLMRNYNALPLLKFIVNQRPWFCPPFSFIGGGSNRNFLFVICKVEAQVILTSGRTSELRRGKSLVYVIHSIRSLPKMPESLSIINASCSKSVFRVLFFKFTFIFIFILPPHRVRWERAGLVEKTGNQEGK